MERAGRLTLAPRTALPVQRRLEQLRMCSGLWILGQIVDCLTQELLYNRQRIDCI